MNKLIIVLALTIVCVGLAAANRRPGGFNGFNGYEDEGFGHSGHGGYNDFDEPHRGHYRGRGKYGRGGFRRGGRWNNHGWGHGPIGRRPIGGFNRHGSGFGAIGAHQSDIAKSDFDQNEGLLLAGGSQFDQGQHASGHNDQDGVSKHNNFNKDKTIIKENISGNDDLDSFHNSQGFNEGSHSSGSQGGLLAAGSSTHADDLKASDSELGAIGGHQGSSSGIEI